MYEQHLVQEVYCVYICIILWSYPSKFTDLVSLKVCMYAHAKPKPHQTMLLQLIQNHGNHIATKMQLSQRQAEIACLLYTHCDQGNPQLRVYKPFCFCLSIARTRSTCVINFIKTNCVRIVKCHLHTYVLAFQPIVCILYLCHHYRHTCSTNYGNNSGRGRWD